MRTLRVQCSTAAEAMPADRNVTRARMPCDAISVMPALSRRGRVQQPAKRYNPGTDGADDTARKKAKCDVAAAAGGMAAWLVMVWIDPMRLGEAAAIEQEPGPPEGGAPGRGGGVGGRGKRKPQGQATPRKKKKTQKGKQIPRTGIG